MLEHMAWHTPTRHIRVRTVRALTMMATLVRTETILRAVRRTLRLVEDTLTVARRMQLLVRPLRAGMQASTERIPHLDRACHHLADIHITGLRPTRLQDRVPSLHRQERQRQVPPQHFPNFEVRKNARRTWHVIVSVKMVPQ